MNAQILRLPARIGARPYPGPTMPTPDHEALVARCAKLRLERDDALISARHWEAQAHEATLELGAERAHRKSDPAGWAFALGCIVGAW